jgi:hypothetical protein
MPQADVCRGTRLAPAVPSLLPQARGDGPQSRELNGIGISMNLHRMNDADAACDSGRIVSLPSADARLWKADLHASFLADANAPRVSTRRRTQCEAMLRRAIDCCADTPSRPLRHIRTSAFMAGSRYPQLAGDTGADLRLACAAAAMVENNTPRNVGEESQK